MEISETTAPATEQERSAEEQPNISELFLKAVTTVNRKHGDKKDQNHPKHSVYLMHMADAIHKLFDEHPTMESVGRFQPDVFQLANVDKCVAFMMLDDFKGAIICTPCGTGKTLMGALTLRRMADLFFQIPGNRNYKVMVVMPANVVKAWMDTISNVFRDRRHMTLHFFNVGEEFVSSTASGRHDLYGALRQLISEAAEDTRNVIVYLMSLSYLQLSEALPVITYMQNELDVMQWELVVADEVSDVARNTQHSKQSKNLTVAMMGCKRLFLTATPLVQGNADAIQILRNLLDKPFTKIPVHEATDLFWRFAITMATMKTRPVDERLTMYRIKVPLSLQQHRALEGFTHQSDRLSITGYQVIPERPRKSSRSSKRKEADSPAVDEDLLGAGEHVKCVAQPDPVDRFVPNEVLVHIVNALQWIKAAKMGPSMIVLDRLIAIKAYEQILTKLGFKVGVIQGEVTQDARDELIRRLSCDDEKTRLDAIIVQTLAGGRGIDVPCKYVFLCTHGYLDTDTEQAVFRSYRVMKEGQKQVIAFSFVTDADPTKRQFSIHEHRRIEKSRRQNEQFIWPECTVSKETYAALVFSWGYHVHANDAHAFLGYHSSDTTTEALTAELRDKILLDATARIGGDLKFMSAEALERDVVDHATIQEVDETGAAASGDRAVVTIRQYVDMLTE